MTTSSKPTRVFWRKGKTTMLCPLEDTDLDVVYRGINDPETYKFLARTLPVGQEAEKKWIRSKQESNGTDITVGICLHDGTLIGTMGLIHIDHLNGTATTGTVIFDEEHRNQGYGTDAKMTLLDYAFNILGLHLVQSAVIGFNGRSAAYSKKCGYIVEARLRSRYYRFGERHEEIILSVTREDWLPLWYVYQQDR